jgi:crotonobetainyl-CoA:carnitine CoA-transferase CaiB-like acyl-CoA transferase
MPKGALEGLRVIEFSNGAVGTFAAKRLAGFGADVIGVESKYYTDSVRLTWGPDNFHRSPPYTAAGLGRKSITANMNSSFYDSIVI